MSHTASQRALYVPTRRKRATDEKWNGVRSTPQEFFDWVDSLCHFTVDVAADENNHKCARYFDEETNGLSQSWAGETAWINCPYGRHIGDWLRKGRDACLWERAFCCFLVPARVDTGWWRTLVMQGPVQKDEATSEVEAGELQRSFYDPITRVHFYRWDRLITAVYFHDERIAFEEEGKAAKDTHGAPFPSALVFMSSCNRTRPASSFAGPPERDLLRRWPR